MADILVIGHVYFRQNGEILNEVYVATSDKNLIVKVLEVAIMI